MITNTCVRPEHETEFAGWQEEMSQLISSFSGYLGGEVIPPFPPTQVDWVIVQRFDTQAHLKLWLDSPQRQQMVERIKPVLVGDDAVNVFVGGSTQDSGAHGGATAVIMTKVAPGTEKAFLSWQKEINAAQAKFPGYVGCELQAPVDGFQDNWVTMLRFDSPANLDGWLTSPVREKLVAESEDFVEKSLIRQARNGFGSWFTFGSDNAGSAPPWKMNYIILLGLYPIVMIEIFFLNPYLYWLPTSIGNFIGNVFSVGILGWPVVWALSKWMNWWLVPKGESSRARDFGGALVALGSVAIMGLFFYFLHEAVQVTPIDNLAAGISALIPSIIIFVLVITVFTLWFSALGTKIGIWGGNQDDDSSDSGQ